MREVRVAAVTGEDFMQLVKKHSEKSEKRILSPENLRKNGFTRYERDSTSGNYNKTAGKDGPDEIPADQTSESTG